MLLWGIMSDKSGIGDRGYGWGNDVGFSGVQIAATWVNPEGPSGEAGGFPGGEGKGIEEELGNRGLGNGVGRGERKEERVVKRWLIRWLWVEKRDERGGEVSTKRVGLVGPVEAVRPPSVMVEVVLGLVVVFENVGEFVLVEVVLRMLLLLGGGRRC